MNTAWEPNLAGKRRLAGSVFVSRMAMGLLVLGLASQGAALGQFTNRYPKVSGYSHHIYLEGFELPLLTNGPVDAAPSPNGRSVALSHRGWIWILDLQTRRATRVTHGGGVDSRASWAPDGQRLVFVRDSNADTAIWELDLGTARESLLIDTPAIDLDPVFSSDGKTLFYSSGVSGDIDLWRLDLADRQTKRLTNEVGLELRPQPSPDGKDLFYISKTRGGRDEIRRLDLGTGQWIPLKIVSIASQSRPSLSPDGRTLAVGLPGPDGWHLWLLDPDQTQSPVQLTFDDTLPITPQWGSQGETIFFSAADRTQTFHLFRQKAWGGVPEQIEVADWDWGTELAKVQVRITGPDGRTLSPARIHAVDSSGHPLFPEGVQPRFDSQHGLPYFYTSGSFELEAPPGQIRLMAVRGLMTPTQEVTLQATPAATTKAEIKLEKVWDSKSSKWASGDHHFHLNYGGQYSLRPEDLIAILRGEDLDVATPLAANLHERFSDQEWMDWRWESPLIRFGQEVRSHFLGHLGLIGIEQLYWPWYWGPGYPSYGADDRPNTLALEHARRQGGIGYYVHPVRSEDPFANPAANDVPTEFIADAVLGHVDNLEIACLWSNEVGTANLWHRLLNLGLTIAPSGGTDAFPNYYRSMAVGSTRVYVQTDGPLNWPNYLDALRQGRSFVTTGPALEFLVNEKGPGQSTQPRADGMVQWSLTVYSAQPLERIEVFLNGKVISTHPGLNKPGKATYSGQTQVGSGGWLTARAIGGDPGWPSMNSFLFAETAPVWIGTRGSRDPEAARTAAEELLPLMDQAIQRLKADYGPHERPRLEDHFARARQRLAEWATSRSGSGQ